MGDYSDLKQRRRSVVKRYREGWVFYYFCIFLK